MALTQRLEFRQSQSLVMTPQLMQAIKLLQLSNLDLATYVEGELERNPLLERGAEDKAGEPAEPTDAPESAPKVPTNGSAISSTPAATRLEGNLGTDLENVFPDEAGPAQKPARRRDRPDDRSPNGAAALRPPPTIIPSKRLSRPKSRSSII